MIVQVKETQDSILGIWSNQFENNTNLAFKKGKTWEKID